MDIIVHRINKIKLLKNLDIKYGVEIDVRDSGRTLVIQHDPFKKGLQLHEFLSSYRQKGLLLIDVKSEGIEYQILKILKKFKIKNFFFLNSTYPIIINLINKKKNFIRVSDFESFENIYKFKGKIKWVWLEIYKKVNLTRKQILYLKNNRIKVCMVSPELHGGNVNDIARIQTIIKNNKIQIDAVCVKQKFIKYWDRLN
tara:strand:- start:121 stop:717 length:597 start_codon:yes stop_codon:yes gene_type:complete